MIAWRKMVALSKNFFVLPWAQNNFSSSQCRSFCMHLDIVFSCVMLHVEAACYAHFRFKICFHFSSSQWSRKLFVGYRWCVRRLRNFWKRLFLRTCLAEKQAFLANVMAWQKFLSCDQVGTPWYCAEKWYSITTKSQPALRIFYCYEIS